MSLINTAEDPEEIALPKAITVQCKNRAEPNEETTRVPLIASTPDHCVNIGAETSDEFRNNLIRFLADNKDVFAWSAKDLGGVDRNLINHKLNVKKDARPRKQKLRKM